jgi:hypothetical protein
MKEEKVREGRKLLLFNENSCYVLFYLPPTNSLAALGNINLKIK